MKVQLHEAEFVLSLARLSNHKATARDAYELCNLSKRLRRLRAKSKPLTVRQERARKRVFGEAMVIAERIGASSIFGTIELSIRFPIGETLTVC